MSASEDQETTAPAEQTGDDAPGSEPVGSRGVGPASQRTLTRMASVGRLAAAVAHEINNPLSWVLGSIELVARHLRELAALQPAASRSAEIAESARAALDNAQSGVERIRRIVRDLATFTRPAPEARGAVDVEAVLEGVLELAWNELRHRARVVKRFTSAPPAWADEARLAQLFLNLVLNATQAIPDGREGVIIISTSAEAERVIVSIEDDGVGIRPDDLPHVFEPFGLRAGSTGLGLTICKNIVTSLGGDINVHSEPDTGTRFVVSLPIAGSTSCSPSGFQSERRQRVTPRSRILIIDDEPLLGQTLRFAFQDKHDVEIAASGREAIERLSADSRFDLVLCDLMMPDVSGEVVFETVKQRAPELLSRFVFMTGGAFTERAQEFLEAFAGRHLEKPFNISEIESLLSELSGAA
jgi:CheY-like chemotaxis protein